MIMEIFVNETITNFVVPISRIFHSLGVLVLPLIATWLGISTLLSPQITIAVVRKCAEMGLSIKHRLKRLYPPSSEGGDGDDKYLCELDHGCFGVLSLSVENC
jgi:hypothetical protein